MPRFPEKAYKNMDFLNSPAARHIRILCEYEEARQRFEQHEIDSTIVFFGSARTLASEDAEALLAEARSKMADSPDSDESKALLRKAEIAQSMGKYYDAARELAHRLTVWSMQSDERGFVVSSGGGPGIMEAANRGAHDAGGRSVGLGISLPFEAGVNDYVTPGLDFEFHYFFTRKLWFLYLCKALVIFPGGFGTMDELFETLTLIQTEKIKKPLPIVLFGAEYWSQIINIDRMVDFGTISPGDVDLYFRTDSVDDAFDFLTQRLEEIGHDSLMSPSTTQG